VGLRLSDQDLFVNACGGLKVSEPAADLAIAAAIASSFPHHPLWADTRHHRRDRPLGGTAGRSARWIGDSPRPPGWGSERCLVPRARFGGKARPQEIEVVTARTLNEALEHVLIK